MNSFQIRIPKAHYSPWAQFIKLEEEKRTALLDAIAKAKPVLDLSALAESIASEAGLSVDETEALLGMIVSIFTLGARNGRSHEQVVHAVIDAVKSVASEVAQPTGSDWSAIENALMRILAMERPLGVVTRTFEVMAEYQRLFGESRIVTDIRPVFDAGKVGAPAAAIVVHNLRIEFRENEKTHEIFLALDSDDIKQLQDVLVRAQEKERSLRSLLESAGLSILS
ncbi:hypothetical protein HUW62_05400 [Myxococcus sp. AM011]|uniref:hypothetical protein n=1 Tax=Myxococcus sp. AM011 TaxID=2745200 RepID=UPI00159576AB|nr:hypothetical protein [Myxococcus sp. AM011]NVJ20657.1 hypothetical protein [Myxococcus sp. AM011]